MNTLTLVGRVGKDPVAGNSNCKFSLAVDRGRKDSNGQKQTDWFNVVLFGKTAEVAMEYVKKGRTLAVSGAMQNNAYEKDGVKKDWWEVVGNSMTLVGDAPASGGGDRDEDERPPVAAAPRAAARPAAPSAPTEEIPF